MPRADRGNEHQLQLLHATEMDPYKTSYLSTFIALKNSLFSETPLLFFSSTYYAFSKWPTLFLKLIRNIAINCMATVMGRQIKVEIRSPATTYARPPAVIRIILESLFFIL